MRAPRTGLRPYRSLQEWHGFAWFVLTEQFLAQRNQRSKVLGMQFQTLRPIGLGLRFIAYSHLVNAVSVLHFRAFRGDSDSGLKRTSCIPRLIGPQGLDCL